MEDPIPQPSKFDEELSPRFDKPIMRAMEKDPAHRTPSAAEFRERVATWG